MRYILVSGLSYAAGVEMTKLITPIGFSFSPLVVVIVGLLVTYSLRSK